MALLHVLDGRGLDSTVRAIQRQTVLYYPDAGARNADLPNPWAGATTLYPDGAGGYVLESWEPNLRAWVRHGGGGGGGTGVTDHGQLTGLGDDDHSQYLTNARGDALFLQPSEVVASTGIAVSVPGDGTVSIVNNDTGSAAVTNHVSAGDPHTQYLRPAEVVAGTGIGVTRPGDGTVSVLNADTGSGAVGVHVSAGDPHAQYLQPAEVVAGAGITVTRPGDGTVSIAASAGTSGPLGIVARLALPASVAVSTTGVRLFTFPSVNFAVGRQYAMRWQFRAIAGSVAAHLRMTHVAVGVANTMAIDYYLAAPASLLNAATLTQLFNVTVAGGLQLGLDGFASAGTVTVSGGTSWAWIEDLGALLP